MIHKNQQEQQHEEREDSLFEVHANNNNNNNNNIINVLLNDNNNNQKFQGKRILGINNAVGKSRALFFKNFAMQRRQYKTMCCQIIFPLLFVLSAGIMSLIFKFTIFQSQNNNNNNNPNNSTSNLRYSLPVLLSLSGSQDHNLTGFRYPFLYVNQLEENSSILGYLTKNGSSKGFLGNIEQFGVTNPYVFNNTENNNNININDQEEEEKEEEKEEFQDEMNNFDNNLNHNNSESSSSDLSQSDSSSDHNSSDSISISSSSSNYPPPLIYGYTPDFQPSSSLHDAAYTYYQDARRLRRCQFRPDCRYQTQEIMRGELYGGAMVFDGIRPTEGRLNVTLGIGDSGMKSFEGHGGSSPVMSLWMFNLLVDSLFQEITDHNHDSPIHTIASQELPYHRYTPNPMFVLVVVSICMFFASLSFLLPVYMYNHTEERSQGLIDYVALMGVSKTFQLMAKWIFDFLSYGLVFVFLFILGLIFQIPFFLKTNPALYLLLFILWGNAQISMAYFLASIISSPKTSALVGYMTVLINLTLALVLNITVFDTSRPHPILLILHPPTTFLRSMFLIGSHLFGIPHLVPFHVTSELSLNYLFLIVASIIYYGAAFYLESVLPHYSASSSSSSDHNHNNNNNNDQNNDNTRESIFFPFLKIWKYCLAPLFEYSRRKWLGGSSDGADDVLLDEENQQYRNDYTTDHDHLNYHHHHHYHYHYHLSNNSNNNSNNNNNNESNSSSLDEGKDSNHSNESGEGGGREEGGEGGGGGGPDDPIIMMKQDEDVQQERNNIRHHQLPENTILIIRQLTKDFKNIRGRPIKRALHDLYLSLRSDECFGLLGPNGAGKTTLISILAGLMTSDHGAVEIAGFDVQRRLADVRQVIGMCPQFDRVWSSLTVEEHIRFYARIKGIDWKQEKDHVTSVLQEVGLEEARRTPAGGLSGGMKRRLSIAIALSGDPKVVLLDEPTTGLDPASKRAVWDIVLRAKRKRCIMLTTHSMEEAEVVCDRMGIMSRGEMLCLGDLLHLKSKFGTGYKLTLNCRPDHVQHVQSFMQHRFPSALMESHLVGTMDFRLSDNTRLSTLFPLLDSNKGKVGITDWSITQSSLEEVFIRLVAREGI